MKIRKKFAKDNSKDTKSLKWLFAIFKQRLPLMIFLILSNAVLSCFGIVYIFFLRELINTAHAKQIDRFYGVIVWLLTTVIAQLIIRAFIQSLQVRIQSKFEISLKSRVINAIMDKDYSSVLRYNSGELITRLTSDIQIVSENIVNFLPNTVSLVTRLALAIAALVLIDVRFCLVFIIGGLLLLLMSAIVRPYMKKLHKDVLEKDGKIRSLFLEIIDSLLSVKVFGIQKKIGKNSDKLQKEHYDAKMKRKNISVLANSAFSLVFQIGYLFALSWSAVAMLVHTTDFGSFTAIIQLVGQIQAPFSSLSGIVPRYFSIIASADRLREIEELADEKDFDTTSNADELYSKLGRICVKDVTFGYTGLNVLENADISIEKGSFNVISGISGIGKSTLFKLILGVISPNGGQICFENTDGSILPVSKNTRSLFAYVPQGNLLMSGTIRESVSLVARQVTQEDIEKALHTACAYDFVMQLENGLDTVIGTHGKGLSEGQMQRLAIARALLSASPILLFDEATSALDEQTEKQLLQNLREQKDKTLILISHKAAAYEICENEIKIEQKKLYSRSI